MSVDDVAKVVPQMGVGTLLEKMDVQSAYRIIPVHPEDHWLLGMQWQGSVHGHLPSFWPAVGTYHFYSISRFPGVGCESPRSESVP